VIPELGIICAVAVTVRARPWGALVLRLPWQWMQQLLLCGYCFGFWVGLGYGLYQTWDLAAVGTAFTVSAASGTLASLWNLIDAGTDNQRLQASDRLK
jgi:hypothetical protein